MTKMFDIQGAQTARERMDRLCEFIEFWAGPRKPEYGASEDELARHSLPEPLRRLYAFAGNWPSPTPVAPEYDFLDQLFAIQDRLVRPRHFETADDGRLLFLDENQGVWDCRTMPSGDDPPVWVYGDLFDDEGKWTTGEKLVSDSLSKFLVTFVLQELNFGSRRSLSDEKLRSMFLAKRDEAIPLWIDGMYAWGSSYNYYLFGPLLVFRRGDPFTGESFSFAANSDAGCAFIEQNQADVVRLILNVGSRWSLGIDEDGSAFASFSDGNPLRGQCPPHTFDFATVRDALLSRACAPGSRLDSPCCSFSRGGQALQDSQAIEDWSYVQSLFQVIQNRLCDAPSELTRRLRDEWGGNELDRSLLLRPHPLLLKNLPADN